MLRSLVLFATALLSGLVSPAHAQEKPVRILLVLGSPKFHDIRTFAPTIEKVLDKVGGFKVTRLEPPADKPPNDDAAVFYTTGYKLTETQERALEKFVEDGGGLVAIHGASASFGNSQAWMR